MEVDYNDDWTDEYVPQENYDFFESIGKLSSKTTRKWLKESASYFKIAVCYSWSSNKWRSSEFVPGNNPVVQPDDSMFDSKFW